MRIYKMTATFGKLAHSTLELAPGLNVIHAPNEWGKSTWCAFLCAMLYGLDTRERSTKGTLAEKERYAPWSGSPMEGRIDLCWKGKNITLERRTKGRIPLGEFRAYETETGLEIPELTAANCGQQLLGVEQSVFRRAGFVRLSDLPVTADDALRRRLNDLVTTGDDSGDAERLARGLKELKNRCRYNRTGLLPQAEEEKATLEEKLTELENLEIQSKKLKIRISEVKTWLGQLENHRVALQYSAAEADAGRVAEARDAFDRAEQQLASLEAACGKLPSREEAERKLQQLREFQGQWQDLQLEAQMLPAPPDTPIAPVPFEGMPPERAVEMAKADAQAYRAQAAKKPGFLWMVLGLLALTGAAGAAILNQWVISALTAAGSVALALVSVSLHRAHSQQLQALEVKYGTPDPAEWTARAVEFSQKVYGYRRALQEYRAGRGDLDGRLNALQTQRQSLCGGQTPEAVTEVWQQVVNRWEACGLARREAQRAGKHLQTLQAMAKTARAPETEDDLTYSEQETARLISDAAAEQQRLQNRLGQYQGRMEALGERETLEAKLRDCCLRIEKLEDTYAALTIAQETLAEARQTLQRRFAPRIARRAQEFLNTMTRGRYDRMLLGSDFGLQAGAEGEDTLREALWRSDGTVDQIYLALRLAVAEALTLEAPLVLDDALVRFDPERMAQAMMLLQEMAKEKQVILFSCQTREQAFLKEKTE